MHEYSVTRALVELCEEQARKNRIAQVAIVRVVLGTFTGFSAHCIEFYFERLKPGTRCANARLEFEVRPLQLRCRKCGNMRTLHDPMMICPVCGNDDVEIVSGREFYVESISGD